MTDTTFSTVYVHAWEYVNPGPDAGGGGFWWYPKERDADAAFVEGAGFPLEDSADFRFDFETDNTDHDDITAEIDAELHQRTSKSARRRVGKNVLQYWENEGFAMGTATEAAMQTHDNR